MATSVSDPFSNVSGSFGSLFAGIGGIDLGLERAGWTCSWQVEIDPYCQKVLARHWPNVPRFGDIKEVKKDDLTRVELVAGGFPCQPVSSAGKRQAQDDERWLWPEFHRIVRSLEPRYVLVENVPGLLDRGMGDVLRDLAESGYDAEWDCIPAAAVGAPHQRDRLFLLAYAAGTGLEGRSWFSATPREARPEPSSGAWTPARPPVARLDDGLPLEVDERRALGNSVVPQVIEWIGRRIMQINAEAA